MNTSTTGHADGSVGSGIGLRSSGHTVCTYPSTSTTIAYTSASTRPQPSTSSNGLPNANVSVKRQKM